MIQSSDEILQSIKNKLDGRQNTPNVSFTNYLDKLGSSQPIRLTEYNIGGSENFFSDRSGNIVANFDNYLTQTGNEDRLAKQQTWYQDLGNALGKFSTKAGLYALESSAFLLKGIPNAISEGSLSAAYNNDVMDWFDDQSKKLDKNFATYYTDEEKSRSAIGKLFTWSYLLDGVSEGGAFIGGALLPEVALGVLTGGASTSASLAKLSARLGAKTLLKSTDDLAKSALKSVAKNTLKDVGEKVVLNEGKKSIRNLNRLTSMGEWAGDTAKTVGFLTRSSAFEAGMEARTNFKESIDNYIKLYEEKYGTLPSNQELSNYIEQAGNQANGVFWGNMAILSISNASMFGKMFDIKPLRVLGIDKAGKGLNKTWDKIIGLSVNTLEDGTKVLSKANNLQKIIGYSAPIAKSIVTEGVFEEGGQGILGKTMQEYLTSKYVKNDATVTYFDAFKKGVQEQFGTSEGGFEVLLGGIIGLMGGNISAGMLAVPKVLSKTFGDGSLANQFSGISAGIPGMFSDSYGSKRKDLDERVGNFNKFNQDFINSQINPTNAKDSTSFRNVNRYNSLFSYANENTTQADYFVDSVVNYNYIKTSEAYKDISDTVADYNNAVDLMVFDPESLKDQDISDTQISEYKEGLKQKFQQDYNSYQKSKKIVDRIDLSDTGLTQGNLTEFKDSLVFSLMSADTAGIRADNIAQQISELTNGETDVNAIKFFEQLDSNNKNLAQEYNFKKKERDSLTQKLAEIGTEIEANKDSEAKMKTLSKQRQASLNRMLQVSKEIVEVEQQLRDKIQTESYQGMKNGVPVSTSVNSIVESYNNLNSYIDILNKSNRKSEANDLKFLLDQFKNFNSVYLDGQNAISRMITTNFFKKNKSFVDGIVGGNYVASDKFKDILREREDSIRGILEDFGYDSERVEESISKLLENNESLSNREKYLIESVVKTMAMQERVQDILEESQNIQEQVFDTEESQGDRIATIMSNTDLNNIEQLNDVIIRISEQIDQLTNIPSREALQEIKKLRKELVQKEQELLDVQNGKLPNSILNPINTNNYAIQEQSTGEILQRESEEIRETRSERGGVEQVLERQETSEQEEVISDDDYTNFVETGEVSDQIIDDIVAKIKNGETLTLRQFSIFNDKTTEIENTLEGSFDEEQLSEIQQATTEDIESILTDVLNNKNQYELIFPDERQAKEENQVEGDISNESDSSTSISLPRRDQENVSETTIYPSNARSEAITTEERTVLENGYGREEDRLTEDISRLRERIEDLETPFKFLDSEGYKKYVKLLNDKVDNPDSVDESELDALERDMDSWFAILGTEVSEEFHLSDLVKQLVALENTEILPVSDTENFTEEEIDRDQKFADKTGGNNFNIGINTAFSVSRLVDIEGVVHTEISNITLEGLEQQSGISIPPDLVEVLPDSRAIRLKQEAVDLINNAGNVRILNPDFDTTSTNYEPVRKSVMNMSGEEVYEILESDFQEKENDEKAYEVKEGDILRLSISKEGWNKQYFDRLEEEMGDSQTEEIAKQVEKQFNKDLVSDTSYQNKASQLRGLKNKSFISTSDKAKINKIEKELKLREGEIRNKSEDKVLKKIRSGFKNISDTLKKDMLNNLRIDIIDSEGNPVQRLKGTRASQSQKIEPNKEELQALRSQVVNNEELLIELLESGFETNVVVPEITVKVDKIFPGHPNTYMGINDETRAINRIYKTIQRNQTQNIIDTGYVDNGKIITRSGTTEDIERSFIKSSLESKNGKKPFIIIRKGSKKIAYPIRIAEGVVEVDLQEFQAIYQNDNLTETEKAIRLNNIIAQSGIDIKQSGNAIIVMGEKISEEIYNNLFDRLQNISYLRNVESLVDKSIDIPDALETVGALTAINLSDPFRGAKFAFDFSDFKSKNIQIPNVGDKSVDPHVDVVSRVAGIKGIKKC